MLWNFPSTSNPFTPKRKRETARGWLPVKIFLGFLLWLALFSPSGAAMQTILPGADWYDTSGNHIYATEGGIIQVGSLYYLWGLDRSQNNSTFIGVNLYSSPDLKNWTFVNQILKSTSNALLGGGATIERAKILYNASTGQFVMWMHYEDHNAYNVAEVAYATCGTIGGNYTFQNHFRPMGIDSRDMNVYQDTDGTAYLLCTTLGNQNVSIFQLDPTYTSVASEVFRGAASNGMSCESHAMIKTGGYYFWIMSLCSGWNFNDNHYFYATSLAGPWTAGGNIVPTGSHTYESQVGWALPVTGSSQTTFVYMGDRWSVSNFSMTRMVMLPLQVSGTSLKLPWYDQWDIDAQTGGWKAGAQIVWNGNYKIINRHSGKALDVLNGSPADAAVVDQYTDNGGANQQWTIKDLGGSDYQITSVNSGKVLDINGAATTVGSTAIQYTSNGGYNQKWHIIDSSQGAGYYRLVNDNTLEKTLEVPGGSTANGTGTALGTFNYSDYQEWQIVSTSATSTPTSSGAGTSTFTATATASITPTRTHTPTNTFSPTFTATSTFTTTFSNTLTNTSTNTVSRTPTPTFTGTFTYTSTRTASPRPLSPGLEHQPIAPPSPALQLSPLPIRQRLRHRVHLQAP